MMRAVDKRRTRYFAPPIIMHRINRRRGLMCEGGEASIKPDELIWVICKTVMVPSTFSPVIAWNRSVAESEIKLEGLDNLIEQIERGAQATGSKDWLDDYIWVSVVRKVVQFTNCQPDFAELMRYRAEIAALIRIAQDLRRDILQAREAADRLKKAYGDRFEKEGMPR